MVESHQFWKPYTLKQDQTLEVCLGPLTLWIHRGEREWHIASEKKPREEARKTIRIADGGFEPGRDWMRWIINEPQERVQLSPTMPDRPLIVRPEMPVCLLPKQSVQFFVGIPIWVSISIGKHFQSITELPTAVLSNSWFGPVTEGELCYALKTTAKLTPENLLPHPHRAAFPLEIRNLSTERLNFERLCLRMNSLNIYQGNNRMWTNKGRVSYRGEEKWSRVAYTGTAPEFDEAGKRLGKARQPSTRGLFFKTFDTWKPFSNP